MNDVLEYLIQILGLPYFGKSDCPKTIYILKKSITKMKIEIIKFMNYQLSLGV